jgi:AraC-like DNA-binding protein
VLSGPESTCLDAKISLVFSSRYRQYAYYYPYIGVVPLFPQTGQTNRRRWARVFQQVRRYPRSSGADFHHHRRRRISAITSDAWSAISLPAISLSISCCHSGALADCRRARPCSKSKRRHSIEVIVRQNGFRDRERMRRAFVRTFGELPQRIRRAPKG